MADLNAINLEITGTSESAQAAIKSTAAALEGLKAISAGLSGIKFSNQNIKGMTAVSAAMKNIASATASLQNVGDGGFGKLSGLADSVNRVVSACKSITQGDIDRLRAVANAANALTSTGGSGAGTQNIAKQIREVSNSVKKAGSNRSGESIFRKVTGGIGTAGTAVRKTALGAVKGLTALGKALKKNSLFAGDFVRSLMRIAKYRALRTILSSITKGASEGMQNLAKSSSEAQATLSQLSGGALSLKNSLGGALYSVLASIVGVLNSIISAAVSAINWVNMLFAILGGRATFKKATNSAKEYGSALGGAAGGAKALKQELMGFDEINSLTPEGGGGGGGGGGGLNYGGMFEETPIDESLAEMVEKADFTLLGERIANKINTALSNINWSKIQTGAGKLAMSIATFINGAVFRLDANVVGSAIAGVVNTALEFVNTFTYKVDWGGLGDKLQQFIARAVKDIEPERVGGALVAKVKIVLDLLDGLLPDSKAGWDEITKWFADVLKNTVDRVGRLPIARVIQSILEGALSAVTHISDAGVLSSLVTTILGAITDTLSGITEQEISAAIDAGIRETWRIACGLLNFVVEIGEITLSMKNPIVEAVSTYALFRVMQKAMSAFGISGYSSTNIFTLAGAIYAGFDLLMSVKDAYMSIKSGEGLSKELVIEIVSNAFRTVGFALLNKGNLKAGAIVLALSVIIEPVISIAEGSLASINASTLQKQIEMYDTWDPHIITAALPKPDDWIGITENDIALISEYYRAIDKFGNIERENLLATREGFTQNGIRYRETVQGMKDAIADYETFSKGLKFLPDGTAAVNTFDDFLQMVREGVAEMGIAQEVANSFSASMDEVANAASEIPDVQLPEIEEVPASAYEGYTKLGDNASSAAAAMQATGEHAEELREKIVEIPSDIVYNLELNNYDQIMKDLDELANKFYSAGSLGAFGFKAAFTGLSDWVSTNVATPITDAFNRIDLASAGRKMMRSLKSGMRAIALPKFKITWSNSSSTANIMGKTYTLSIPTPKISTYAKGGFPTAGELFLANEAGPEMVGRIGNKPAVANQEQIGDAIFKYMDEHGGNNEMDTAALASAIVSALKAAGLGAVYLDGKMLGNSINREAKRTGKPVINF